MPEGGAGEDVAREKRDDEAGRQGCYHGAFANPLDMARTGNAEQQGRADEDNVEDNFQASEIFVITPCGIFHEPFGAHYRYIRLKFKNDACRLTQASRATIKTIPSDRK